MISAQFFGLARAAVDHSFDSAPLQRGLSPEMTSEMKPGVLLSAADWRLLRPRIVPLANAPKPLPPSVV
ncbi:MAG: hypothetical protein QM770_25130 [Tepidisphaeraceae bacterium]